MKEYLLLTGRFDRNTELLAQSLEAAGYSFHTLSLTYDGFLQDHVWNPFAYYTGALDRNRTGKPLYFNRLPVPRHWEIAGNFNDGEIIDLDRRRAKITYAFPESRRYVKTVEWFNDYGRICTSDHYDRFGKRFAMTVMDAEGKAVLRTYYDSTGCEVITENLVTRNLILHKDGRDRIFDSIVSFSVHFMHEAGLVAPHIFYNSLAAPYQISEYLGRREGITGDDILFWQEPVQEGIPGNMRTILDGSSPRTRHVFVQRADAYERLISLGAQKTKVDRLGFVYRLERENKGTPNALILTNSDRVEQLSELAEALPEITFTVGALTEMSRKLLTLGTRPNIITIPTISGERVEALFKECDFYLDINHGREICDAVNKAFFHNLLILGFSQTLHNKACTAPTHVFSVSEAEQLKNTLLRAVTEPDFRKKCLADQMHHAMVETAERYRELIGGLPFQTCRTASEQNGTVRWNE